MPPRKASSKGDNFVQMVTDALICSSGSAGSDISQILSAYTPKDRTGIIIHRVEYDISNTDNWSASPVTSGDRILFGLCFLSTMPETFGFNLDDVGVIDYNSLEHLRLSAVGFDYMKGPFLKDWSTFPGGGLLVHPANFYCWVGTPDNIAADLIFMVRVFYSTVNLSEVMYRELWESRIIAQSI